MHGVQEQIEKHALPTPRVMQHDARFHVAGKPDLGPMVQRHGILHESHGFGENILQRHGALVCRLHAKGDVPPPLDAAKNRGGQRLPTGIFGEQISGFH